MKGDLGGRGPHSESAGDCALGRYERGMPCEKSRAALLGLCGMRPMGHLDFPKIGTLGWLKLGLQRTEGLSARVSPATLAVNDLLFL